MLYNQGNELRLEAGWSTVALLYIAQNQPNSLRLTKAITEPSAGTGISLSPRVHLHVHALDGVSLVKQSIRVRLGTHHLTQTAATIIQGNFCDTDSNKQTTEAERAERFGPRSNCASAHGGLTASTSDLTGGSPKKKLQLRTAKRDGYR